LNNIIQASDAGTAITLDTSSNVTIGGGLKPHYDSDWVSVSAGNDYDFTHNLGTKMLIMQIYFKDASDRIFSINSTLIEYDTTDTGIFVYMESTNKINIGTSNANVYAYDNTSLGASFTEVASGTLRILAWKTGVAD
jgi:hypothetical protein